MNRREINKLESEMQLITSYIAHTPDYKAKMLYADKLLEITPLYIRLVYHSQQVIDEVKNISNKQRGSEEC